jgi:hypothetical protein
VVERILGKAEVDSSILSGGAMISMTIQTIESGAFTSSSAARRVARRSTANVGFPQGRLWERRFRASC